MPVLEYLGLAVIFCALGRVMLNSEHNFIDYIGAFLMFLALPVSGALQALESSIKKRRDAEYAEGTKAAATIAAIEALPSDMREAAWQRFAWSEWNTDMSYDEWHASISIKCGFDELFFYPSTSARWEIEKLRREPKPERPK